MPSVIQQSVVLPASAETLFNMYLDAEAHTAFTGQPAVVTPEPGSPFSAFGGILRGNILAVVKPTLIVQTWRSTAFKEDDPDSTLILTFTPEPPGPPEGEQGRIDLVHLDVPGHDYDDVTKGWPNYYWNPWRTYLETHS